ncbi:hypothetical protein [Bradyrhizobium archetypum]|uniref:Sigma-70 family RNA polymerase sigma factor n=1 Tax=Bradyrhizobium archetypum TaxID=2721160 RepID=A0A7Y4H2D9_9BRAD|nr:hypothetical protein [Bradyrhizobium archetypum]NOJ46039.1 hypothetical protein [Bradyrhizobium archetypum]
MSKTRRDPDETATPAEVADALRTMTSADRVRLERFARLRSAGLPGWEWEDLLHEAIDRALSGLRKWPRSISMVEFMCGTIRSISGDIWREGRQKVNVSVTPIGPDMDSEIDVHDQRPGPEREVIARSMLTGIFRAFEDDSDALAVLKGLADALGPEEIQRRSDMNARRYASAQKRIRRRISRILEEQGN